VSCTETTKHRCQCENNKLELFGADKSSHQKSKASSQILLLVATIQKQPINKYINQIH